jgi:hypothetical protein
MPSPRPIFHKLDETTRGHVFCSFLALVLKSELKERVAGHRRSGFTDKTEIEYAGKTLHRSLGAAPGCQPGPAGRRRRPASDRPRRRSLLIPPQRKCTVPGRRRGSDCRVCSATVEDGLISNLTGKLDKSASHDFEIEPNTPVIYVPKVQIDSPLH